MKYSATVPAKEPTKAKTKIYVALATYANNLRRDTHQSLVEIYSAAGRAMFPDVEFMEGGIGGDGVARARNGLSQDFVLNSDATHFLCVDIDIRFQPYHVKRLLDADKDIIGGLYAAKQMNHRWIMNPLPDVPFDPRKGVQKVNETGTGLKLIKRKVFEDMIAAYPEIGYLCDGRPGRPMLWDFWSMGVVDSRYLSEDYYFDYRARKIGYEIYCDGLCQIVHEGLIGYPFTANLEVFDGMTIEAIYDLAVKMGCVKARDQEDLTNAYPCHFDGEVKTVPKIGERTADVLEVVT